MIDISALVAALRARSVMGRILEYELAWELARATYAPIPGEITPQLVGKTHEEDYRRVRKLVKSVGARALDVKVAAAVGAVTWGDDASHRGQESGVGGRVKQDAVIERLRLDEAARKLAEQWNVDGIVAVHAYRDRATGHAKLTRLTGYLEPYLNRRNMDEAEGLYQAKWWLDRAGKKKWWVRVYDWGPKGGGRESGDGGQGKATVREWQGLEDPLSLGHAPDQTIEGAEIPAVRLGPTTEEGLVTSRFLSSVPLMRAIYATELSLERARELAAWPIPVFKNATAVTVVSPAVAVQVAEDGDFYFAEPGNLAVLQSHLENRQARFNSDMNLPAGLIGGNRSGESIREENVSFYNDARQDARVLSGVLSEGLERYASIADGIEAVPVSVSPNVEYLRDVILQGVVQLVDKGLLPASVAMREVQPFFASYSDEELQKAIEARGAQREVQVDP